LGWYPGRKGCERHCLAPGEGKRKEKRNATRNGKKAKGKIGPRSRRKKKFTVNSGKEISVREERPSRQNEKEKGKTKGKGQKIPDRETGKKKQHQKRERNLLD